eukprot:scaffold110628_cov30-Tisochrysis_lutea.AAC.6
MRTAHQRLEDSDSYMNQQFPRAPCITSEGERPSTNTRGACSGRERERRIRRERHCEAAAPETISMRHGIQLC